MMKQRIIGLGVYLLAVCFASAAMQLAGIFTDGAVFQQGEPVRIWGTADPQEVVTVSWVDQQVRARADADGTWMATLDPLSACATPCTLRVSGVHSQVVLTNILVGEVWLAGGQSNMETTMGYYRRTTQPEIDAANDPFLRMVTVPRLEYAGQNDDRPQWNSSTTEHVPDFSASAYYFAKNLREALGVPVGIISCNVGGTPAEAWMSRQTLSATPDLKRILDAYDRHVATAFASEADYLVQAEAFQRTVARYRATPKTSSKRRPKPVEVMGPRNYKRPCGLYETMLVQVIPYTVRGAIWYQGENNANAQAGLHYRSVFSSLIEQWRTDFQNPDLPFLFVQLATLNFGGGPAWPELRDAQRWVEENVPHTGMAVMVDGGEEKDIHPHSKDKVGQRLALLARNLVYGESDLICRGPTVLSVETNGSALALSFSSPPQVRAGEGGAFEVCGADGRYVPARGTWRGQTLWVESARISNPVHVRYGWKKWFVPVLFGDTGLPVAPFRTDDFPFESRGRFYLDRL